MKIFKEIRKRIKFRKIRKESQVLSDFIVHRQSELYELEHDSLNEDLIEWIVRCRNCSSIDEVKTKNIEELEIAYKRHTETLNKLSPQELIEYMKLK